MTDTPLTLDPSVIQRQASDPKASVWVGASAGTGKTKVLTDRLLRLFLEGSSPERVLCLTFTKTAAREMSNRINAVLSLWATCDEAELDHALHELTFEPPSTEKRRHARQLFSRVLECPGGMKIMTIHSFCQSLLGRFPLEAGIHPHFKILEERDATTLMEHSIQQVLKQTSSENSSPLSRAIERLCSVAGKDEFYDLLKTLMKSRHRLQQLFNAHDGLSGLQKQIWTFLSVSHADVASLTKDFIRAFSAQEDRWKRVERTLAAGKVSDVKSATIFRAWLELSEAQKREQIDSYLKIFLTTDLDKIKKRLATKDCVKMWPELENILLSEADRAMNFCVDRQRMAIAQQTLDLLCVAESVMSSYENLKHYHHGMDFQDLISHARNLLDNPATAPWVLYKMDGGLDHILVDEAQDTSPDQWHIIASIANEFFSGESARSDIRTLFVVGDEKQSIFSFQGADVDTFSRTKSNLQTRINGAEKAFQIVDMRASFRSTGAILKAVDAVFSYPNARVGVTLDGHPTHHVTRRRGQAGLVEIWPVVRPDDTPPPSAWPLPTEGRGIKNPPAQLASTIATHIRRWLNEGDILSSRGRTIRPGDILILVQRRGPFFEYMVKALKDQNIPVTGADRMILMEQLAIKDLAVLGDFLLLPDDDLTLATVLKTPLIGLTEEELFTLAHERSGTLWQSLQKWANRSPMFHAAYQWLLALLNRTDFETPFALFSDLLNRPCPADDRSGRRAFFKRLGQNINDILDEFLDACLTYEQSHPSSLQGFLHWLSSNADDKKREFEADAQDPEGQVRIMTTHGAKGLQAPIVILPDTCHVPSQTPKLLWTTDDPKTGIPLYSRSASNDCPEAKTLRHAIHQRRDEEYRRLLYVAMTRAEDRLYIGGWEAKNPRASHCWYNLIEQGVQTLVMPSTTPIGEEIRRYEEPQTGEPDLQRTWQIVSNSVPPPLPSWALQSPPVEKPPYKPLTPSRPEESLPAIRSPLDTKEGFFRRGTVIHRLLQILPNVRSDQRISVARAFLAQPGHQLPVQDQGHILTSVMDLMDHPAFKALFGPSSQAEVPVTAVIGDHALVGQMDRLCVMDKEVWVVDYKTHRKPPTSTEAIPAAYINQMAAYASAVQSMWPDKKIRAFLLWTENARLMEIPSDVLRDQNYDAAKT